ncbi:molybdopterin cofactor-binding domain-containing protein [Marinivivus vitaminiproducens]|uniref:xanthine dehydrogenase family protein molybdopterin-binding subunit n=1 Tax=Marinivivus vitaminiproducens TaxID=3035935 RepID=UPI0027A2B838|nr:xanthine dehydrogenase family protein molybdopterin-binding subunit [Geminicoccaceae bacterium SCSIO 64248]
MRPLTFASPPRPSRRQFLIGTAAAGAGLTLGFHIPKGPMAGALAAESADAVNAYLRIAPDSTVTVFSAHMDGGQGIYTGIATLVAEELDADWSQMHVEGAYGNPKLYGNMTWGGAVQGTGGSSSVASSWERYRRAGALGRAMLAEAASSRWGVPASEIVIDKGVVSHASGQRATFGELADAAAQVAPPSDIALKAPENWAYIGREDLHRLDNVSKTNGQHQFPIDVYLPGMVTAVLARPPRFGGKVRSFDPASARQVKGVVDVVETPRGVAVVAKDTWSALQGREALTVEWDDGEAEMRGTAELMAEYRELARGGQAVVARNDGDAEAAFAEAARVIEAEFEFPYLAHAAMEPLDAVATFENGVLEIWAGHQMPDLYQQVGAEIMGIEPSAVKLHVMMPGGFFGRRAVPDADVIVEVVSILKATGAKAPVKVVWTREDDMKGGRYRPMYVHRLQAALDQGGALTGWRHRIVGQSIMAGTPFEAMIGKDSVDPTSVEGASNLPYAIPNMQVDLVTTKPQVPVLWWRAVGSTHTAYSTEVFLDEVAEATGQDPVAFRRALLQDHPRHMGVLDLVVEKSGWGTPLPEGRFRGIAVHESFNTYVAQVVEIALRPDGGIKVERAVCAVDCGIAVNPDVIRAQMEGGIGFGLGAVLKSEITLNGGEVEQGNFDTYQVLTIEDMPRVEVHIVPSQEAPTGVGEPGVPPIGPAVANAVFAATGKRIRILPFSKTDLGTV